MKCDREMLMLETVWSLDSRVKTKGGWFFILGFNMLNFQICQTQHVKHNFYRQSLFWFIYRLLFWNFRHRLVRHYWYMLREAARAQCLLEENVLSSGSSGQHMGGNMRKWQEGNHDATIIYCRAKRPNQGTDTRSLALICLDSEGWL